MPLVNDRWIKKLWSHRTFFGCHGNSWNSKEEELLDKEKFFKLINILAESSLAALSIKSYPICTTIRFRKDIYVSVYSFDKTENFKELPARENFFLLPGWYPSPEYKLYQISLLAVPPGLGISFVNRPIEIYVKKINFPENGTLIRPTPAQKVIPLKDIEAYEPSKKVCKIAFSPSYILSFSTKIHPMVTRVVEEVLNAGYHISELHLTALEDGAELLLKLLGKEDSAFTLKRRINL